MLEKIFHKSGFISIGNRTPYGWEHCFPSNPEMNDEIIKSRRIYIHSSHQLLALDIAQAFDDPNIGPYMRVCKQFPEHYIRRIWGLIKEMNPAPNNKGRYFIKAVYNNDKGNYEKRS